MGRATLSSVADALRTPGCTLLTSPREAGQVTTLAPCSTAGNPRWPAPLRNANAAVDGAVESRSPQPRVDRRALNLARSDAWLHMLPS